MVVAVLVAAVTLGGIKRISNVAEKIVPAMAGLYIIGAVLVLIFNIRDIPAAVMLIVKSAFNPKAALGGAQVLQLKWQYKKRNRTWGIF